MLGHVEVKKQIWVVKGQHEEAIYEINQFLRFWPHNAITEDLMHRLIALVFTISSVRLLKQLQTCLVQVVI